MVAQTKDTNTSFKPNNNVDDDNNLTLASFVEIFTACLKVAIFITCVYVLKEIFFLINELFLCVDDISFDVLKVQVIPVIVLLILAGCAFWIMSKD